MGLFVCDDCGHKVSETANHCPNCGASMSSNSQVIKKNEEERKLRELEWKKIEIETEKLRNKQKAIKNAMYIKVAIVTAIALCVLVISFLWGLWKLAIAIIVGWIIFFNIMKLVIAEKISNVKI